MHCICAGNDGGADERRDVEIAALQRRWSDAEALVGKLDVERIRVSLGVDRDRSDSEFAASANDAEGDFTPVRNQYLFDVRYFAQVLTLGIDQE